MPCLDMPVEKLMEYKGMNPKPKDFDEFWERALREMEETDPETEFREADFKCPFADCFDMTFTGVKGAKIYAKHIRPKNITGKIPAVLMFHGYSGDSGDWVNKLPYAAAGIAVFAMDCRGQGGKSEDVGGVTGNTLQGHIIRGLNDEPDKLLFRDVFLDTAELGKIASGLDYIDENNIFACGGSQGGGLTIACASLFTKIKKAYPTYPFLSDYKRVWDMDLDDRAYIELKQYFRHFDPRHEREEEIFTKLGYIDIHNLAPRITAEIVMFTGLRDDVCPPSTQFAAYNNMTCPKKVYFYPEFGHEGLPDNNDIVFEDILNSID